MITKFLGAQLLASGHLCEVDKGFGMEVGRNFPLCLHWVSAEILSHLQMDSLKAETYTYVQASWEWLQSLSSSITRESKGANYVLITQASL